MKSFGIIYWQRKFQNNLILTIMWLVVIILCRSIIKKSKQSKKKQSIQFKEKKKAPGNVLLEPRLVLLEVRRALMGNGIK